MRGYLLYRRINRDVNGNLLRALEDLVYIIKRKNLF